MDERPPQKNNNAPATSKSTDVKASKKTAKSRVYVPSLEYITVEEFDGVPK